MQQFQHYSESDYSDDCDCRECSEARELLEAVTAEVDAECAIEIPDWIPDNLKLAALLLGFY